jgi:hypothetical protein
MCWKWTVIGPVLPPVIEVTGQVTELFSGGFDLFVDQPMRHFFSYVSSKYPNVNPDLLHCETYPINPPTDPNGAGSNSYPAWAMPDCPDVPGDPLINQVWDTSQSPPTYRPLQAWDRVVVRGQLRLENGHPLDSNGNEQGNGGTGWGFMELHPYDWRNVRLVNPAQGFPPISILVAAPLYSYVKDGGLTGTSGRVWVASDGGSFFNQVNTVPIQLGVSPQATVREIVVANTTGQPLEQIRYLSGVESASIPEVNFTVSAPPTQNYGGQPCADINDQRALLVEYYVRSGGPITGGYLRHSVRSAGGDWQTPAGDVNGVIGDIGWVSEVVAVSSGDDLLGFPVLTDTARTAYLGRRSDGSWIPSQDPTAEFPGAPFPIAYAGRIEHFAAVSPGKDEELYLLASADGHLWQTGQNITQSWQNISEVTQQLAVPGRVKALAGTSSDQDEVQFLFVTDDGRVWHTIGQVTKANWWIAPGNVVWQPAGDATGQFGDQGPVVSVAAVSPTQHIAEFVVVTEDGTAWHTVRAQNGSWQPLDNLNVRVGIPTKVIDVAAASPNPDESHVVWVAEDGNVWHVIHNRQTDTWTAPLTASAMMGLPDLIDRVAAAPSPGVPGEIQCIMVTRQS